jgi:predicted dehydrogenase
VASRDATRAAAYAAEHGIPGAYGSYEELLAADDIDVVYNPLPNHLHAPITIAAAQAGKHVLCEKPLALTVAEVDAIAEAAEATRVVVAEAFMYRHHEQTSRVRELIASGAIGRPHTVRGSFSFPLDNPGDVRLDATMGGGSLWDVGCYPVSYARTMVGAAPVEVAGWWQLGETGVDLSYWGQLRFPAGAVAQVDSSFTAPFRAHMEVVGDEGVITIPQPFKPGRHEFIYVGRDEDNLEPVEIEGSDLFTGEVEDIAAAVLDGAPQRVTLEDSRANTATLVALLRSAVDGRPVAL